MFCHECTLFASGGRSNYRIPSIITTKNGTLLAFCNDRKDSLSDHAEETALVYARKLPGKSWEPVTTLSGIPGWCCMIGSAVYDADTDTAFCTVSRNPVARNEFGTFSDEEIAAMEARAEQKARELGIPKGDILFQTSDGAQTWSEAPIRLLPRPFTSPEGKQLAIGGSCHGSAAGIQLKHGTHKGRLLCPSRIFTGRYTTWEEAILCCFNNSIYSDDHGKTWHASAPVQQGTGEGTLIEDENGTIHYNSRGMHRDQKRYLATSADGGQTYQDFRTADFLYEEISIGCNASFLRVERDLLPALPAGCDSITLFANPRSKDRSNMTICISYDSGQTWSGTKTVWSGGSAYSSLAYDAVSQHFFLLYEKGESAQNPYEYGISLLEFDLDWLLS